MTLSMTTWHRLEPRVRGMDPGQGLRAAVHDPLWLLGRQWQVGELLGEDAASPVSVRVETVEYPLSRWRSASGQPVGYDPQMVPLEALVEREPPSEPTLRDRLDAWTRLVGLLQAADLDDSVTTLANEDQHQLPPPRVPEDPSDARLRRLVAGHPVADGWAVAQTLAADASGLPADLVSTFLGWIAAQTTPEAGDCWVTNRLEYRFSVAAHTGSGELVLTAPEYRGGRLDWYDLDVDTDVTHTLGATANAAEPMVKHLLPMRVSFPGMPNERFWAFEDASVDLGAVTASTEDLGRLVTIEFATVFGNDWWSVPIRTHFGGLVGVQSLMVRDSFGQSVLIPPTEIAAEHATAPWRMFRLTDAELGAGVGPAPNLLLLAPVVTAALDGDAIEELLLLRDEMANLAWGIERIVEGADGRQRNRSVEYGSRLTAAERPQLTSEADLIYLLQTTVPAHWIPLMPVRDPTGSAAVMLQRASLLTQDGGARPITAQGVLLSPEVHPWYFHQEEVPRAGLRIRRVPSIARWVDGASYAWTSRRSSSGSGEGSSGLQFDIAVPHTL